MTSARKNKEYPNAPTPSMREDVVSGGVFMRVAVLTKTGARLEISNNLCFEAKAGATEKVKQIAKNTIQINRLIIERSTNETPWYPNIVIIGLHDTRKHTASTEVLVIDDNDI